MCDAENWYILFHNDGETGSIGNQTLCTLMKGRHIDKQTLVNVSVKAHVRQCIACNQHVDPHVFPDQSLECNEPRA